MKINTTVDITEDRISDLLCDAFEGGVRYWATIRNVEKRENSEYLHDVPLKGGIIYISAEDEVQEHELTRDAVEKGLQVMADKYPHHFINVVDGNHDCETGDVFLQCCLFEEIVYG